MDITIKYPSHNDLVQWYYQLAKDIAEAPGVTPEDVNALIAAYIEEHPYPVVPADVITETNAAQNVVTSVNGKKGDVTVTGGGDVPDNVITTDNIAQNAVTSFNGMKGAVTGVTSVNGMYSQNAQIGWYTGVGGGHLITFAVDAAVFIADITVQCVNQNPPTYAGVLPNPGYEHVSRLVGAQFLQDPTPFVPSAISLETSEGVWTIVIHGIASGRQVSIGDQKTACITAIISGIENVLHSGHE